MSLRQQFFERFHRLLVILYCQPLGEPLDRFLLLSLCLESIPEFVERNRVRALQRFGDRFLQIFLSVGVVFCLIVRPSERPGDEPRAEAARNLFEPLVGDVRPKDDPVSDIFFCADLICPLKTLQSEWYILQRVEAEPAHLCRQ